MTRSIPFFATLLCGALAYADAPAPAGDVLSVDSGQSKVTYHLVHKLHKFEGVSKQVAGKALVAANGTKVQVSIPVQSFDSGNSNRDAHMKETVEAARYPAIDFKCAGDAVSLATPGAVDKTFHCQMTFHGVTQTMDLPVHLTVEAGGRVHATAHMDLSVEGFKIERPSLMFVKIDDKMPVDIDAWFKK